MIERNFWNSRLCWIFPKCLRSLEQFYVFTEFKSFWVHNLALIGNLREWQSDYPYWQEKKNQLRLVSNVSHLNLFYLFIYFLFIFQVLNQQQYQKIANKRWFEWGKFVKMIVEVIKTPWNLAQGLLNLQVPALLETLKSQIRVSYYLVQFFKSVISQNCTEKVWKENIA